MGAAPNSESVVSSSLECALPVLLPYLPPLSLLAVQSVCRSWLRATLQEPTTWWTFDIHNFPRSSRTMLADEHLLAWTRRAQLCEKAGSSVGGGSSQGVCENGCEAKNLMSTLDLTGCVRLTGGGLQAALGNCTSISKLCVGGCVSVRPSSLVQLVQSWARQNKEQGGKPQLRSLQIGGLLSEEHDCMLQELLDCLVEAAEKKGRIDGMCSKKVHYNQEEVDLEELGWYFDHCCPQCRTCSTLELSACEEAGCPYRGLSSLGTDACDLCRLECPRCERTLCQGCHFDMARCPVCHESKCEACVSACLEGGIMAGDESSDEEDLTVWQA